VCCRTCAAGREGGCCGDVRAQGAGTPLTGVCRELRGVGSELGDLERNRRCLLELSLEVGVEPVFVSALRLP
jgi:hypothetical protein